MFRPTVFQQYKVMKWVVTIWWQKVLMHSWGVYLLMENLRWCRRAQTGTLPVDPAQQCECMTTFLTVISQHEVLFTCSLSLKNLFADFSFTVQLLQVTGIRNITQKSFTVHNEWILSSAFLITYVLPGATCLLPSIGSNLDTFSLHSARTLVCCCAMSPLTVANNNTTK